MRSACDKKRLFRILYSRSTRCVLKSRTGPVLLGIAIVSRPGSAAQLELSDRASTRYVIVQAADASESEVHAVAERAEHLKQVTGAGFTVVSDTMKHAGHHGILLGCRGSGSRSNAQAHNCHAKQRGFHKTRVTSHAGKIRFSTRCHRSVVCDIPLPITHRSIDSAFGPVPLTTSG